MIALPLNIVGDNTSTSPNPVSNFILLELKVGGRKGVGGGTEAGRSLKQMFEVLGGGLFRLAPALVSLPSAGYDDLESLISI